MVYRIWIVEDDTKIAALLREELRRYGYEAMTAESFRDLKEEFLRLSPHLVLLDINLPYFDGFYWCRQIRTVSHVPILFISARVGEMNQVMAIENGGDDYITKPFPVEVVLAKVKGALRRAYGEYALQESRDLLETCGLFLHRAKNRLEWREQRVDLSRNECLLFAELISHAGEVVAREQLLSALWDDAEFVDDNTLTVNIARARRKLKDLGLDQAVIETVRGQGYRFRLGPASTEGEKGG
ncbi:response regulator protein GraR [Peptococcaceae bacterium CEB3]|nr:response regulator protein GraR [Peptococcaceae bacterium CEB3]